MLEDDDEGDGLPAAHAAMVAEGWLEPLSRDEAETRAWLDCELGSLVENRFFAPLDPRSLGAEERARWEPRATSDEPLSSPHNHRWYRVAYWLREGGERVGTIALATQLMGIGLVTVSSLYTLPEHRRRGVAARALRRAQEVVVAHGLRGLRVPTHWSWQPAVRFYLGLGMWLLNWKHSLVFCWREGQGEPRFEIGDDEARGGVVRGGEVTWVVEARREGSQGERLGWRTLPGTGVADHVIGDVGETLAVALATRGWPLVRSEEGWAQRHRWSDCGEPEGLAGKIELWEAWERRCGHEVRTPRLPGIPYRGWEEIEGG